MKRNIYLVLISLYLPLCANAISTDSIFKPMKDTVAFKVKLTESSSKLVSIESSFKQEKSISILTETVESDGYFCYKNKNMVRWEYQKPFKYIFVINKEKIIVKDDSGINNYDMTANQAFLELNTSLTAIIDGSILDNKGEYSFKYFESVEEYMLELTPLDKGVREYFKYIYVYFDKKDLSVSGIKMLEPNGDYTKIKFFNKKINQELSDEKFIIR